MLQMDSNASLNSVLSRISDLLGNGTEMSLKHSPSVADQYLVKRLQKLFKVKPNQLEDECKR
jgi:hypothetical protein